jgi:protoporphyrinogen/coproporphyrinogen III oxidase
MSVDVVVIGAGVSGLATAHDLVSRGYDVQVLERQVSVGGNAVSERFDGYLMEHGPSTLNAANSGAMAQICALGLAAGATELGASVRKRYLRDADRLWGISVHPLGFFLSNYLSPAARLSMAAEILRPRKPGDGEETLHQFASRRFGRRFADKVIDPMAAGMFMGDANLLSVADAFPQLVELERKHGSIMRGILRARSGSEPVRRLFSWPGGIATLPQIYARVLAGRIHCGTAVTRLVPTRAGFEVVTANAGTIRTRSVVLAVQPHVAASLLEDAEPDTAMAASEIQAPPVAVVFLGYRTSQVSHPLDGLGFLGTRNSNRIISGAQFSSTMFGNRAPDGHVSITCYIGGARNPGPAALPAGDLVGGAHGELADLLGITGGPVVSRTRYWPRGLPQYTLGHKARQNIIETANHRAPGLFLTGNYLNGVSVANCMVSAAATARNVHLELGERQTGLVRKNRIEPSAAN